MAPPKKYFSEVQHRRLYVGLAYYLQNRKKTGDIEWKKVLLESGVRVQILYIHMLLFMLHYVNYNFQLNHDGFTHTQLMDKRKNDRKKHNVSNLKEYDQWIAGGGMGNLTTSSVCDAVSGVQSPFQQASEEFSGGNLEKVASMKAHLAVVSKFISVAAMISKELWTYLGGYDVIRYDMFRVLAMEEAKRSMLSRSVSLKPKKVCMVKIFGMKPNLTKMSLRNSYS